MCLVLTGIHAYLGIHVIAREVVFDLPTGATVACAFGVTVLAWGGVVRQRREAWTR